MKPKQLDVVGLALAALFASIICACSQGSITLNPGDTFTYEFNTLPFVESVGVAHGNPGCGLTVFLQNVSGVDFRFETFEDSLTETPFISNTFQNIGGGTSAFWYGAASHWQDLQGIVRFTGLSGTVVIDHFQIDAYVPHDASSMDLFSTVVVPEPSLSALSVLAVTTLCAWRRLGSGKRSPRSHNAERSPRPVALSARIV